MKRKVEREPGRDGACVCVCEDHGDRSLRQYKVKGPHDREKERQNNYEERGQMDEATELTENYRAGS